MTVAPSIVLAGHGGFGRLYAQALARVGALGGVVVRSEASAERVGAAYGAPSGTELGAVLDEAGADALCVLTPTATHARLVRAAVARGLPCMVIKPVTSAPDTSRTLAAEAKAAGVPVLAAHEGVFAPAFMALAEEVRAGRIGNVTGIRWVKEGGERLSGGRIAAPPRPEDEEGRNVGYLYATAMHELYVANRLAGRKAPKTVEVTHAVAACHQPELDAHLEYGSGVAAHLRYDGRPDTPFRRGLQVLGTDGSLLWLTVPGRSSLERHTRAGRRDVPFHGGRGTTPADAVVAHFLAVVRGEAEPAEGLLDGANALEAARALASAVAARIDVAADLDAIAGGVDLD